MSKVKRKTPHTPTNKQAVAPSLTLPTLKDAPSSLPDQPTELTTAPKGPVQLLDQPENLALAEAGDGLPVETPANLSAADYLRQLISQYPKPTPEEQRDWLLVKDPKFDMALYRFIAQEARVYLLTYWAGSTDIEHVWPELVNEIWSHPALETKLNGYSPTHPSQASPFTFIQLWLTGWFRQFMKTGGIRHCPVEDRARLDDAMYQGRIDFINTDPSETPSQDVTDRGAWAATIPAWTRQEPFSATSNWSPPDHQGNKLDWILLREQWAQIATKMEKATQLDWFLAVNGLTKDERGQLQHLASTDPCFKLSNLDIAEKAGVHRNTVSKHIQAAETQLKKGLTVDPRSARRPSSDKADVAAIHEWLGADTPRPVQTEKALAWVKPGSRPTPTFHQLFPTLTSTYAVAST